MIQIHFLSMGPRYHETIISRRYIYINTFQQEDLRSYYTNSYWFSFKSFFYDLTNYPKIRQQNNY